MKMPIKLPVDVKKFDFGKLHRKMYPHIRSKISVSKIMFAVIFSLLPATIAGVYYHGTPALLIILTSIITCVLTEFLIQKLAKKPVTVLDGSAIITGLLLALIMPPAVPLYVPALGAFFAMAIVKHCFGGLGKNIFNPALAARVFVGSCFPVALTSYIGLKIDGVTSASPLGVLKFKGAPVLLKAFGSVENLYSNYLMGNVHGCIGETSALLLLLGGLFLIFTKIIDWRTPVFFIGSVAILAPLIGGTDPIFSILSGGVFLGAFFMATDYVTAPANAKGKIIFAIGCGLITVLIRVFGGYPEGVCFSILIMNAATPLIERYTMPRVYGTGKMQFTIEEEKK